DVEARRGRFRPGEQVALHQWSTHVAAQRDHLRFLDAADDGADALCRELADDDAQEGEAGGIFDETAQPGGIEGHELRFQALQPLEVSVLAGIVVDGDGKAAVMQARGEGYERIEVVPRVLPDLAGDARRRQACLVCGKPQPFHLLADRLGRRVEAGVEIDDERGLAPAERAGIEDVQAAAKAVHRHALFFRHALEEFRRGAGHVPRAGPDQPLEGGDLQAAVRALAKDRLEGGLQEKGAIDCAEGAVRLPDEIGEDASFAHAAYHPLERPDPRYYRRHLLMFA